MYVNHTKNTQQTFKRNKAKHLSVELNSEGEKKEKLTNYITEKPVTFLRLN